MISIRFKKIIILFLLVPSLIYGSKKTSISDKVDGGASPSSPQAALETSRGTAVDVTTPNLRACQMATELNAHFLAEASRKTIVVPNAAELETSASPAEVALRAAYDEFEASRKTIDLTADSPKAAHAARLRTFYKNPVPNEKTEFSVTFNADGSKTRHVRTMRLGSLVTLHTQYKFSKYVNGRYDSPNNHNNNHYNAVESVTSDFENLTNEPLSPRLSNCLRLRQLQDVAQRDLTAIRDCFFELRKHDKFTEFMCAHLYNTDNGVIATVAKDHNR